MAAKHPPTTMRAKLWALYNEVRIKCDEPGKAPAIRIKLLMRHREKLAAIDGAIDSLLADGLEADIRRMLKAGDDSDPAQHSFILLWHPRNQKLVTDIDRDHVFVPSRGEFVHLTPIDIDKDQVNEAGEYLITKGAESIRVGRKLTRLARTWVDPRASDYYAYCQDWIETATEAEGLQTRWDNEHKWREQLGVSVKQRLALKELLDAKLKDFDS
jgi:hypothetical protein